MDPFFHLASILITRYSVSWLFYWTTSVGNQTGGMHSFCFCWTFQSPSVPLAIVWAAWLRWVLLCHALILLAGEFLRTVLIDFCFASWTLAYGVHKGIHLPLCWSTSIWNRWETWFWDLDFSIINTLMTSYSFQLTPRRLLKYCSY